MIIFAKWRVTTAKTNDKCYSRTQETRTRKEKKESVTGDGLFRPGGTGTETKTETEGACSYTRLHGKAQERKARR